MEDIHRWKINWDLIDVMIGGRSSIDIDKLAVKDWKDATKLLKNYGFNPDIPLEAKKIHSVIVEAINFIRVYLIPEEWQMGLFPPDEILYAEDAQTILLLASSVQKEDPHKQAWACAVLRVMHTICHIEGVIDFLDLNIAREQILSRFQKFIFTDSSSNLRFGTVKDNIKIYKVEWKNHKSRNSIILKLLHKTANVAETIYDHIGIRIITEKISDVLMVIKYLRDYHMITVANCNPSRSKNSLIDMKQFQKYINYLFPLVEENKISEDEFSTLIDSFVIPKTKGEPQGKNPHSSYNYKSIQLTCRQLIQYENPSLKWISQIEELISSNLDLNSEGKRTLNEIISLAKNQDRISEYTNIKGFFPFEVHVLDKHSALENTYGRASHKKYKFNQIKSARKRVLGKVLLLNSIK